MICFDAPKLIGPVPCAGRLIEHVEAHGKHLEVTWDDGLVLDTHLKGSSEWHVYRQGVPWRRSWEQLRASIQTDDWVAVCFNAPDRRDVPAAVDAAAPAARSARPRPDVAVGRSRRGGRAAAVVPRPRCAPARRAGRPARGAGRRQRLPLRGALGARDQPVGTRRRPRTARRGARRQHRRQAAALEPAPVVRRRRTAGLAVYGRSGQPCLRCHETIEARPVGRRGRMLYWCPGCQVRLDREHDPADGPQ